LNKKALLAFLIALYFAARLPALRCNPYGDEAWYFYISKRLYWNWDPHLPFLPPIRWAFMIIMHPFTQNIWVFRSAYVAINSLGLVALYLASRSSLTFLLAGLMLVLDPVATFFTGAVFTSTLSSTFLLLSLAFESSLPVSLLFALLSVGSWEGALFPFLALSLVEGRKDKRKLLYLIPVALALATSFDNKLYRARLPGWSRGPLTLKGLELLFYPIGYFMPFLLNPATLLLAWSEALGLIAVNLIKGTALEVWYLVPAHALYLFYFSKLKMDRKVLAVGLLGLAIGLYAFKVSIPSLYGPKDCCHLKIVNYLEVAKGKAVLYHVFWAYPKYPYGEVPHKYCLTLGCLSHWAKRYGYVVTENLMLKEKWLKLIYHEGACYLFKTASRPG